MAGEREMVLRMLKEGKISLEEADALLKALLDGGAKESGLGSGAPPMGGADVRAELREMITELRASIPRELRREVSRARDTWVPGLSQMLQGLWGLAVGESETSLETPMAPGETLSVRNAWGDLHLTGSLDVHLRVKARKRVWAVTAEEASEAAQRLEITLQRVGAGVSLAVPQMYERRVCVDLELAVPTGVAVGVELAKGDIRASALQGPLAVDAARADVLVETVSGAVEVGTARGDVRVREVTGDVEIDVKHGDVTIRKVSGSVTAETVHGSIDVEECAALSLNAIHGDITVTGATGELLVEGKHGQIDLRAIRGSTIKVRTKHGDVALRVAELGEGGEVTVGTVRGDIEVALPPAARATIDAAVRAGRINSSAPLLERTGDRFRLRGLLNGPGGTVTLRTTSGDIEVRTTSA